MHQTLLAIIVIVLCFGPEGIARVARGLAVLLVAAIVFLWIGSMAWEHSPEHLADVAEAKAAATQQAKLEADPEYQHQRAIEHSVLYPTYIFSDADLQAVPVGQYYRDCRPGSHGLYLSEKK